MQSRIVLLIVLVVLGAPSSGFGQDASPLSDRVLATLEVHLKSVASVLPNDDTGPSLPQVERDLLAIGAAIAGHKKAPNHAAYALGLAVDSAALARFLDQAKQGDAAPDVSLVWEAADSLRAKAEYAAEHGEAPFFFYEIPRLDVENRSRSLAQAIDRLNASLGALEKNLPDLMQGRKGVAEKWDAAQRHVARLQEFAGKVDPTDQYLTSVDMDSHILEQVSSDNALPASARKVLYVRAIRDIETKAASAQNAKPASSGMIGVVARTKDGNGDEAPNYTVWYAPDALVDDLKFRKRFRKFSSPTNRQDIAAGNYFMWAIKDKVEHGETIPVGDDGNGQCDVDVRVGP